MPIDLDELERLAAQATPGPWEVTGKGAPEYITDANPNRKIARILRTPRAYEENAHYIVAACNAVPELIARVRELEVVEESLARNLADTAFCPLCLIKDCPQYGKGDLGMRAFEPELVDREQCKKSIIAHARQGAKEFIERAEKVTKEAWE